MADLDDYLRCIAPRRRRYLLYHLRERDVTTVENLSFALSCRRATADSFGSRDPEAITVELRHHHLPKLEELSLVDYDPRSGAVNVLPFPPLLEDLLDATRELERSR